MALVVCQYTSWPVAQYNKLEHTIKRKDLKLHCVSKKRANFETV